MIQQIRVANLKPNPNNPRIIKDEKFAKLVESIRNFPEMLEARPIVVNKDMVVLGGNMRLRALIDAGIKEAPVEVVDWDAEKQAQFIIKDNVSFGDWDWDSLANEWDLGELSQWGIDLPSLAEKFDEDTLNENDSIEANNTVTITLEMPFYMYSEVEKEINDFTSRNPNIICKIIN